jgi:hypothetical protein
MLFSQNSIFEANSLVLARMSIAKSAIKVYFMTAVALDNAYFLTPSVKFCKPDMYELFGEAMGFLYNRKKQKSLSYSQNFDATEPLSSKLSINPDLIAPSALPIVIGKKRKVSSTVNFLKHPLR